MQWEKTGREVKANGESTVFYATSDGRFRIESRKKAVPHAAGRSGSWIHTTYFLFDNSDGSEKEYWSLKEAREEAEKRGGCDG